MKDPFEITYERFLIRLSDVQETPSILGKISDSAILQNLLLVLDDSHKRGHGTSYHRIEIFEIDTRLMERIAVSGGGATCIHKHSALVNCSHLLLAIGPMIACFDVPSLSVVWKTIVDDATCFGVYLDPSGEGYLSHGELAISKLDAFGNILWQRYGQDIFTGEFIVHNKRVEVSDFNGRRYEMDLDTGDTYS